MAKLVTLPSWTKHGKDQSVFEAEDDGDSNEFHWLS